MAGFINSVEEEARYDFINLLNLIGYTEEDVQAAMDAIEVDIVYNSSITLKASPIQGTGAFTEIDLVTNAIIGIGHTPNPLVKTELGRYLNHSPNNNCRFVYHEDGSTVLVAEEWITAGTELTCNYRDTLIQARRKYLCQQQYQ